MKFKIFWAGTHTDSAGNTTTFTAADVQKIAANYSIEKHEAPIVIGHPKTDDPAYGWIKSLSYNNEDSTLYADVQQVDPDFKELVNAGRYKKVSAALYPPNEPTNPVSGAYYLRHVGFLGAQPPALKQGQSEIRFSDHPNIITYEFIEEMPEKTTEKTNGNDTPAIAMSDPIEAVKNHEFAEKLAFLNKKEAELKQREQELKQTEIAQKRAEIAQFAEKLSSEGKVLPRHVKPLTEFILGIQEPTATATFAYSEEGQTVTVDRNQWFTDFLKNLPSQVEFAELSRPQQGTPEKKVIPESPLEKHIKAQYPAKKRKGEK